MATGAARSIRQLGLKGVAHVAARRFWSTSRALGLRVDVEHLPPPRTAKVPVAMKAIDPASFGGFESELQRTGEADSIEVLARLRFCRGGVTTLYVAEDEHGEPIYAQWLVRRADQDRLRAVTGALFPPLAESEALVEGAYTFLNFRGCGAMADGMHQLLRAARDGGAESAITYVTDDNVPSLRGCAKAGFELDHVRLTTRRLGVRKSVRAPLDGSARRAWAEALA